MARCPSCIHFSLCDYNTNIAGDTKIKLYYDDGAEKCSFYKPAADVVEVETIKAWLYEMAFNNVGEDDTLSEACTEIISRLDGLRTFARERRGA